MEINKLKEYLFAMYIGQKVAYNETEIYPELYEVSVDFIKNDDWFLQLRPLSSITDDEAIECLCSALGYKPDDTYMRDRGHNFIDVYAAYPTLPNPVLRIFFKDATIYIENIRRAGHLAAYQYLQQQGFALPVYYKGVQYPVEQLTDWGFIKIKA